MQTALKARLSSKNLNIRRIEFLSGARSLWFWWFLVLLLVLFVQILTIDVLPHLQQDEVQITDYGRLALNPTSDWAVTWLIGEDKPLLLWSYVGPLIAELSFIIGGESGLGPRIASLVGALFAASMVFGWLTSRKIPVYASYGLGLAFLLDPLFVLSQRMGRVDAWVIGCCIASCWLLQLAKNKEKNQYRTYVTGAGGFAALAAFVWPSAIFLFPLIILELLDLHSERAYQNKAEYLVKKVALFGLGGIIASSLLLLPILNSFSIIFGDMGSMVAQNIDTSKSFQDQLFALFDYKHWEKLAKVYIKTLSPVFPILALFAVLAIRNMRLIIATVASISIIFASMVYEFRALYLLPYFVILISGLFTEAAVARRNAWLNKINKISLITLVLWSIVISLGLRTILGFESKPELDRDRIYELASSSVGKGEHKVFLYYNYEFYFAGRSLGWEIFVPYKQYLNDSEGNWIRNLTYEEGAEFGELLSEMDFALFSEGSVNENLQEQLAKAGLEFIDTPQLQNDFNPGNSNGTSRNKEMILWFLRGKDTYGSYELYGRRE